MTARMNVKMYFFVNCCPRTLEKLTNKLAEADVTKRVCGTLASPANKGFLLDRPRPGHHSITASQLSSSPVSSQADCCCMIYHSLKMDGLCH